MAILQTVVVIRKPGGIILFTQFWDYNPASGPADSFTIHSIWNDYCSGGYPQFCDTSLEIDSTGSTIESIVVDQFGDQTLYDNMNKYWTDINGNNKNFGLTNLTNTEHV